MINPFKNIFSRFSSIGKIASGGETNALGIDIGSSAIKVVEIKKKGAKQSSRLMGQYLLVLMRGSMLAGSQICRWKN